MDVSLILFSRCSKLRLRPCNRILCLCQESYARCHVHSFIINSNHAGKKEVFIGGSRPGRVSPSYALEQFAEISCPLSDMQRIAALNSVEKEVKCVVSDVLGAVHHEVELSRLQRMMIWDKCQPVYNVMAASSESPTALKLVRVNLTVQMTPVENELFTSKVACTQRDAECIAVETVQQTDSKRYVCLFSGETHCVARRSSFYSLY